LTNINKTKQKQGHRSGLFRRGCQLMPQNKRELLLLRVCKDHSHKAPLSVSHRKPQLSQNKEVESSSLPSYSVSKRKWSRHTAQCNQTLVVATSYFIWHILVCNGSNGKLYHYLHLVGLGLSLLITHLPLPNHLSLLASFKSSSLIASIQLWLKHYNKQMCHISHIQSCLRFDTLLYLFFCCCLLAHKCRISSQKPFILISYYLQLTEMLYFITPLLHMSPFCSFRS